MEPIKKATYEDVQDLKFKLASSLSAFKDEFPTADVAIVLKAELITRHGKETLNIKVEEIPAVFQGALPYDMNAEIVDDVPRRLN